MTFDLTRCNGVKPRPWIYRNVRFGADLAEPVQGEIHWWDRHMNPADDQGNSSTCESRASCGIIEALIKRYYDPEAFVGGKQLDAARLHREAWKLTHLNEPDSAYSDREGLYIGDTFKAMMQLEIIPTHELERVSDTVDDIRSTLLHSPILAGLNVTPAWDTTHHETGEIGYMPPTGVYGHAVVLVGLNQGQDNRYLETIVNSWGTAWAWHGVGQMEHERFRMSMLDTLVCPRFDAVMWFRHNHEWRRWLA